MRAGHADQEELARDLVYLCDPHHGHERDPSGSPQPRLLRWGSSIVVMPSRGNFVHAAKEPGSDRVSPLGIEFLPFPPQGLYSGANGLPGDDLAGPPFGFRVTWFHPSNPRRASYDLLCVSTMGPPDEPQIVPHTFSVRRAVLALHGATGFAQEIMREVQAFEDWLCCTELSHMPLYESSLEYVKSITVAGLLRFFGRMNSRRSPDMWFDTVFLSHTNFMRMATRHDDREGFKTPHHGVLVAAGCTIVASEGIKDDVAYFTSFRDGPTLVRGPTVIRCGEDRFDIEHYCDTLPARNGSTPDIPVGFAVRLVPAPARGASREGQKIPIMGEPLNKFLAVAYTLHKMGEHAMALAILEKAPRTGREGERTCALWERVLGKLGMGDSDLVASHNDLLVCTNRLIASGYAGDGVLEARVRVMRRLGLA